MGNYTQYLVLTYNGKESEREYIYKYMCVWVCGFCGLVTKSCPTLVTPWTVAHQPPLSMGFSRQEYWSGLWILY